MNTKIETTVCREVDGDDVEVAVEVTGVVRWEPDEWLQCYVVEDFSASVPVTDDERDGLERELIAACEASDELRREDALERRCERYMDR